MWRGCLASLIGLIASQVLYSAFGLELFSILRTTALTVFYHLAVRLILGEWVIPRLCERGIDGSRDWFRVHAWETALYRRLKVHRWKGAVPTYSPDEFSMRDHTLKEIVEATCRAELVHEVNAAASFLPLLFALWFGALPVFLITSIAAAAFDLGFVAVQRYNRPRLTRLIQMEERGRNDESESRD